MLSGIIVANLNFGAAIHMNKKKLGLFAIGGVVAVAAVVGLLSVQGFGMGLTMSPTMVAGLGDLPPRLVSQGSAVRSLITQMSGAVSVAVLGAVVTSQMGTDPSPQQAQSAYNLAFLVAACGVAIALVVSIRLPSTAADHDGIPAEVLVAAE